MNKDTWESLADMGHSPKMIEAILDEQEVKLNKINGGGSMRIMSWKLVAFDEDDNEINVDVHSNDVASLIDDFLTEEFEGEGVIQL